MQVWILSLSALICLTAIVAYRYMIPDLIRKKAQRHLRDLIFPEGEQQMQVILKSFRKFTCNRFSEEELLDYYMKIKGLQNMNSGLYSDFWVKKYLMSPTLIKLNYFEQVQFYQNFICITKVSSETSPKKKSKKSTPVQEVFESRFELPDSLSLESISLKQ